jgi:hypothetical protein
MLIKATNLKTRIYVVWRFIAIAKDYLFMSKTVASLNVWPTVSGSSGQPGRPPGSMATAGEVPRSAVRAGYSCHDKQCYMAGDETRIDAHVSWSCVIDPRTCKRLPWWGHSYHPTPVMLQFPIAIAAETKWNKTTIFLFQITKDDNYKFSYCLFPLLPVWYPWYLYMILMIPVHWESIMITICSHSFRYKLRDSYCYVFIRKSTS